MTIMPTSRFLLSFLLAALLMIPTAAAQMDRQRSVPQPDELFWSPAVILLPSTTTLKPGDLDFTIHHTFGPVSGGLSTLFGLDDAANIRFGLDYGVTPWAMIGVGRSRFNKTVDFRAKARVFNHGHMQASLFYNAAVETLEDGRDLVDRMSYHTSVLVAHRVTKDLVIQVSPGFTRFVYAPDEEQLDGSVWRGLNNHWSIGSAVHYELKDNVAVTGEYLAVMGERTDETTNVFSVGVDIETGGHVFQMFFSSTQWITPQHAIAWSRTPVSDMDFGWGFNVHRVFGTGR